MNAVAKRLRPKPSFHPPTPARQDAPFHGLLAGRTARGRKRATSVRAAEMVRRRVLDKAIHGGPSRRPNEKSPTGRKDRPL
jgi:hypothetical protein